ncbi:MAG: cobalamin-binding protein [Phycisphaerales bacterium]|nr:cobalamin-binding protein [Phycisphaerales bacterium]
MPSDRIASLLASSTEILYGLGLGDRVVAVSHECDHPRDACSKPRVTFTHIDDSVSSRQIDEQVKTLSSQNAAMYQVDVEQLIALRPDLIVTQAQCDVCAVRYDDVVALVRDTPALEQAGIVALNPESLEDLFRDIEKVGRAAGAESAAREYIESLRRRVATVQEKTGALNNARRPRVVCIEWIEPVIVAANWMPDLIQIAGGQSGMTRSAEHSGYSNWTDVTAYGPEVIVVMPCGLNLSRTVEESRVLPSFDGWADLPAVRQDRVFAVDGNAYFNRSGPRLVDSLEILAGLVHPDLFSQYAEFYEDVWHRLSP